MTFGGGFLLITLMFISAAPVLTTLAGSQVTRDGLSLSLSQQIRGVDTLMRYW